MSSTLIPATITELINLAANGKVQVNSEDHRHRPVTIQISALDETTLTGLIQYDNAEDALGSSLHNESLLVDEIDNRQRLILCNYPFPMDSVCTL